MAGRVFIDTNLWVYTIDGRNPRKRDRARQVTSAAVAADLAVISSQVSLEFAANLIRKLGVQPKEATKHLNALVGLPCVSITPALASNALGLLQSYSLSVWDAAIVAAALEAECDILLTEDMLHGQRIGSLTIVDPFKV